MGGWMAQSDWARYGLGVVVAAVVAYFTTIGAIQVKVAALDIKQQANFEEVLRRIDDLKQDLRELRRGR